MGVNSKYYHSCVNCEGMNTDERNEKGLPCEVCLPEEVEDVYLELLRRGALRDYEFYHDFWEKFKDFERFFFSVFKNRLTSYQRLWARRLILGKSFTMVAPTGVGKTTFGLVASLWMAKRGKKSVLVFPTITLVKQALERLREFGEDGARIYGFHSSMKAEEKKRFEEAFERDEFDILVLSTQFVSKNREKLKNKLFDFVFVDDVDAVLKASKNVDTLLSMVGIPEEIIEEAYNAIKRGKSYERPKDLKTGVLVVSSATARPRGLRVLLFKDLLDFTVGRIISVARNITHVRIKGRSVDRLVELLKMLGSGVLLFVQTEEEGRELSKHLHERGIKLGETWTNFEENFEAFRKGKLDVLVGVHTYYGKLVRGVDLPERIKYVVFWGAPVMRFSLDLEKAPQFVLERVLRETGVLKSKVADREALKKMVREKFSQEEFLEKAKAIFKSVEITEHEMIIPDVYTYIQATGRASRILGGVLVKGLSVIFEDDDDIFEALKTRLVLIAEEEIFEEEEVDWQKLREEVEESRRRIPRSGVFDSTRSVLIVVESPTKAETLSKFLGKASSRRVGNILVHEAVTNEGVVLFTATRGHVYDLVTKGGVHGVEVLDGCFVPVYNSIKRCRSCGYQFTEDAEECPKCSSRDLDDKTETLKALREVALEVDEVLVATDPDVEGEKISWDVVQHLRPVNPNVKRIEMHEITRYGFKKARENERYVDFNLVKSQIVRRVEDRWIGFELSGKLQKAFKRQNLSAGRVQSTVLGWIVEREKEYEASEKLFSSLVLENGYTLEIEGKVDVDSVEVLKVETFEEELMPPPPHTASTVLSEVSQKLRMNVQEVMDILQDLFEKGFITYHRTDSVRISVEGQAVARSYLKKIGKEELFHGRGWSTEGAHEAIRPVKPVDAEELQEMMEEGLITDLTRKHVNVYRMVMNRFLASQSKPVIVEKSKVLMKVGKKELEIEVIVDVKKEGWNTFSTLSVSPRFSPGTYRVVEKKIYKKHTVPLFTQASIVEEMKRRGIGRPSTYAKIVEVLFKRDYVYEDKYGRIRPTKLGTTIYNFLKEKYERYITEETTRRLEEVMELVEEGRQDYQKILKELYEEISILMLEER